MQPFRCANTLMSKQGTAGWCMAKNDQKSSLYTVQNVTYRSYYMHYILNPFLVRSPLDNEIVYWNSNKNIQHPPPEESSFSTQTTSKYERRRASSEDVRAAQLHHSAKEKNMLAIFDFLYCIYIQISSYKSSQAFFVRAFLSHKLLI